MSLFKKIFGSKNKEQTAKTGKVELPDLYDKIPWMTDLRRENLAICLKAGFKPAR